MYFSSKKLGVPITIFVSKKTKKPLIDERLNKKIIEVLQTNGVDSWFTLPNEKFLTSEYNANDFEKVFSILDVVRLRFQSCLCFEK